MTQPQPVQPDERPWRVLLVDDHPIVRKGLNTALAGSEKFTIVGEADNADDAMSAVDLLRPDLMLLDIRLKGSRSGIEVANKLKESYPALRIVVLTNHAQEPYLKAMMEAGVDGYLLKDTPPHEILQALNMVAAGRNVYSEQINVSLVSGYLKDEGVGNLTAREAEILQLVADGLTNEQIGSRLNVGQKAVQLHLTRIYSKLEVSSRTEAIVRAAKLGLIVIDA